MRWPVILAVFTAGLAVGVPTGLIMPMLASARLADAEREVMNCDPESTVDAVSPDGYLRASLTRFNCSIGMSYEYKLRVEPAEPKDWFVAMDIDANGDGRIQPTMGWDNNKTLVIHSSGEVASGTYSQKLGPVGSHPSLFYINLTTVFSRPSTRS